MSEVETPKTDWNAEPVTDEKLNLIGRILQWLIDNKMGLDGGNFTVAPTILNNMIWHFGIAPVAIQEIGSNANGRWIKFTDGTMICDQIMSKNPTAGSSVETITWTYPAQFTSAVRAWATCEGTGAPNLKGNTVTSARTTTDVKANVANDGSTNWVITVNFLAIGRWNG